MILYYCMGGGLGHVTRTLTIIHHLPQCSHKIRMMTSGPLTTLLSQNKTVHKICEIDHVHDKELRDRKNYQAFLVDYVNRHHITHLVLDTFPFGIAGEWANILPQLPRLLIARRVKWFDYLQRLPTLHDLICPTQVIVTEQLQEDQQADLAANANLAFIQGPISSPPLTPLPRIKDHWLIIHSGSKDECNQLIAYAKKQTYKPIDMIFPERNIYPSYNTMRHYRHIVCGAGYNLMAYAWVTQGLYQFHPIAFPRKFDDQQWRLDKLSNHSWFNSHDSGAKKAAMLLDEVISGDSKQ